MASWWPREEVLAGPLNLGLSQCISPGEGAGGGPPAPTLISINLHTSCSITIWESSERVQREKPAGAQGQLAGVGGWSGDQL